MHAMLKEKLKNQTKPRLWKESSKMWQHQWGWRGHTPKKIKKWNVVIVERHDEQNKKMRDNRKWHPKQKKNH
jgi:hypothetical protein